jgi:hypothetical protein
MKSTTATGTGGALLFVAWLWNDLFAWGLGGFPLDKFPVLSIDAAAGLFLIVGAVLTRFVDKLE